MSLEVLFSGTNGQVPAREIVQLARSRAFFSPREILSATNVSSDVYTNNVFALTTFSRSPDLNIFGQPKMAVIPLLGGPGGDATNMVINGITLRPVQEIYPTPLQLPVYGVPNPVTSKVDTLRGPWHFVQSRGALPWGAPMALTREPGFIRGMVTVTITDRCWPTISPEPMPPANP